jgi:hypothetical protein
MRRALRREHACAWETAGKIMENKRELRGSVNDEASSAETFARLLPEIQALSPDELIPINLDVPSVVATTLGALPEIRALRQEIAQQMPAFDLAAFDKLEEYAVALHHAHTQFLMATQPNHGLDELLAEGAALRQTLFLDATALSHRGFIDKNKLNELPGPNGHKNLATDLGTLAAILKESWAEVQSRSGVQEAELERADKLAQRIVRVVGLREQGPAMVAAATDLRLRAFTLLFRTYDNVRRAVTFLRWNGSEADKIAPSLYAGRSNGRRRSEPPSTDLPPPVPAPVPPGTPVASAGPVAAASAAPAGADHGPFMNE